MKIGLCAVWLMALLSTTACANNNFDPQSLVRSVRILATRADKPYAKPGDTVQLEALAVDGREQKPEPMTVFWIPNPCLNVGSYSDCYADLAKQFAPNKDLTPQLVSGATLSVQIPPTALAPDQTVGTANVFHMACAGYVQYVGLEDSPAGIPFGCFDKSGNQLGSDDFVFAYARIFLFRDRINKSPIVEEVLLDGSPADPNEGFSLERCNVTGEVECPETSLDVRVGPASQEVDTSASDLGGQKLKEQIWVDYYVTAGAVGNDLRLLYDANAGALTDTATTFQAPKFPFEATLFAVVHDNRGGIDWRVIPIQVK